MSLKQIVPLNRLFLFCCVFAAFALFFSWWAEFRWKLELCQLCRIQRLALAGIFPLSLLGLVVPNKKWPAMLLLWSLFLLLLVAAYHLLVQWGFVADGCATPQNIQTLDDFRSMLYTSTPCTSSWPLLDIPVSVYNVAFALLGIFALKRYLSWQIIFRF